MESTQACKNAQWEHKETIQEFVGVNQIYLCETPIFFKQDGIGFPVLIPSYQAPLMQQTMGCVRDFVGQPHLSTFLRFDGVTPT
jgi:hypothetical protein